MQTVPITKQQAKLFLSLLECTDGLMKEDDILSSTFGKVEISVFDKYLLEEKLKKFLES